MPRYEPTLTSLRAHPVPDWYHDAKLGIFIHWGLFSIPAFAPRMGLIHEVARDHYDDFVPCTPYTEWYENAIKFAWSPSARFHAEHYDGQPYAAFREPFKCGVAQWDPAAWAGLFRAAGARYVVLVAKHHDGFSLWPTGVRHPYRDGWHTARDIVGELAAAVRAQGLRFGVYYSGGIDWSFNPTPLRTPVEFFASVPDREPYQSYAVEQVRELIERVQPDVLWNDICWPTEPARLRRLFADYYNALPEGVVNDRWQTPTALLPLLRTRIGRGLANGLVKRVMRWLQPELPTPRVPHYDFRTPEYTTFRNIRRRKWEANRGLGRSFGYNRDEQSGDLLSITDLVHLFVDIVSKNGNLLLNLGPRGDDAAIPEAQAERVLALGAWLTRNAEAIYGTRPWIRADGTTTDGIPVRFTCRGDTLYAILLGTPQAGTVTLAGVDVKPVRVRILGGGVLDAESLPAGIRINLPQAPPSAPACAFALDGAHA